MKGAAAEKQERHGLVGPAQLWQMKRDFQIHFLQSVGLRPQHSLLDIGCGTLRGGIPLIRYLDAGRYTGVEVRDNVLEEGRQELKEENLEHKRPTLIHAENLARLDLPQDFDFAWSFSVLIHLSDEIAEEYFAFLARQLAPDGSGYGNYSVNQVEDGAWREFPLVHRSLDFYRDVAGRHGLSAEDVGTLESCGHHSGNPNADSRSRMLRFRHA